MNLTKNIIKILRLIFQFVVASQLIYVVYLLMKLSLVVIGANLDDSDNKFEITVRTPIAYQNERGLMQAAKDGINRAEQVNLGDNPIYAKDISFSEAGKIGFKEGGRDEEFDRFPEIPYHILLMENNTNQRH